VRGKGNRCTDKKCPKKTGRVRIFAWAGWGGREKKKHKSETQGACQKEKGKPEKCKGYLLERQQKQESGSSSSLKTKTHRVERGTKIGKRYETGEAETLTKNTAAGISLL